METLHPLISSSVDPTKLSATVTGILVSCSSIIIAIAFHFFGVQISVTDFTAFATQLGVMVGAIYALYGLLRKGVIKAGSIN